MENQVQYTAESVRQMLEQLNGNGRWVLPNIGCSAIPSVSRVAAVVYQMLPNPVAFCRFMCDAGPTEETVSRVIGDAMEQLLINRRVIDQDGFILLMGEICQSL